MSATDDTLRTRLYFTGDCDGFPELRDALAQHSELEVIGSSEHVAQATGVLAGGHLDCILHATRSETFPATEIAAIREQTRAPVVVVASGSATAILEEALERGRLRRPSAAASSSTTSCSRSRRPPMSSAPSR